MLPCARKCLACLLLIGCGAAGITPRAGAGTGTPDDTVFRRLIIPTVVMEKDRRTMPGKQLLAQLGATGLVRCGAAIGTAQLTLKNDVITTAAHVLIGPDGRPRAGCVFEAIHGHDRVPIDMGSIRSGSQVPLDAPATRDWAVARLVHPVRGAIPYGLAATGTKPGRVVMLAGGNREAAAWGAEQCAARNVMAAREGIREFAIDCNAGPGSSGAALLGGGRNVVAIYVGFRSADPKRAQVFSATHYNFAITVEGPFRRALLAAAAGR